ncbi:hypothetical protein GCM10007856_29870 [Azospirillum oryzae]|nr:hypothetical protein GCM10007856_29870 [Azospirillum oryzae]
MACAEGQRDSKAVNSVPAAVHLNGLESGCSHLSPTLSAFLQHRDFVSRPGGMTYLLSDACGIPFPGSRCPSIVTPAKLRKYLGLSDQNL